MFNRKLILQPKTVINCTTEAQAIELLNWANSIGKTWSNGDSYINNNEWNKHKTTMCYDILDGRFSDTNYYTRHSHTILSFDEALEQLNILTNIDNNISIPEYIKPTIIKSDTELLNIIMIQLESISNVVKSIQSNQKDSNETPN